MKFSSILDPLCREVVEDEGTIFLGSTLGSRAVEELLEIMSPPMQPDPPRL